MSGKVATPIIREIKDNRDELKILEDELLSTADENTQDIIMNYPTVYIHNWPKKHKYEVYVGEANDVFRRTREHYREIKKKDKWQHNIDENPNASLYIIGHELFNKSFTLDVENRLMHYLLSVNSVKRVHNGRANPQNKYYPSEEFETVFGEIWKNLHNKNAELFPDEQEIKDSAIFKASPFHKLTDAQLEARDNILETIDGALKRKTKQIIFVDGEAGTGKTVLNSSTFVELFCKYRNRKNFKCSVVINHVEQVNVYKDITDKLGITEKYGEAVTGASKFLNLHPDDNSVDVVFIDEAHLLFTEGNQGYSGKNQLDDIVKKAKVVVIVFDQNQILRMDQYWESQMIDKYRRKAIEQGNHIELTEQLRIVADEKTLDWIDSVTKNQEIKPIPKTDSHDYEIKIFDSPITLEREIRNKAADAKSRLSRMIANYDWDYVKGKTPSKSNKDSKAVNRMLAYQKGMRSQFKDTWGVYIEDKKWYAPWNYETKRFLPAKEKRATVDQAWAEQKHTIDEVGSTFTIQGFDLNYAGVILGESVTFKDGKIEFNPEETSNKKVNRNRTMEDGTKQCFAKDLLKHELRVLLTRGVNGLYIYACDKDLREALIEASK
ncbi:DUF2075 domain-containing protein [Pseudobutyrivibrio sp.]|uniref:DUF2075 domain-containing protein n=1 Tax=Pseudobutyrivibrio sp. TaxID=2014367 RepID=UPI0038679C77